MERIFLSMSFRPEDQPLVSAVSTIIETQDLRVVTGRQLAGAVLTEEIRKRIDNCDALVALCSRRDALASGGFSVSQWVRDELAYAVAQNKPALALVEEDVQLEGMLEQRERAHFDRANPSDAYVKLAVSLAQWRQDAGIVLRAAIVPAEIAIRLSKRQVAAVEFCVIRNGTSTAWRHAPLVKEVGGMYAYLRGVPRDSLVQIRAKLGKKWLESVATAPHYYFTLVESNA